MTAFGKFLQDHFLGVVFLLVVCGLILGIIGTYISMFLISLIHIYEATVLGVGYG
jgi:hypothetical protein